MMGSRVSHFRGSKIKGIVGVVAWGLLFAGEEHVGGVGGGDVVGEFVA
jgi:hypothetical protein